MSRDLEEYRPLYSEGAYKIKEVTIHEGDVVLDAEANMGTFSMLAAAKKAARVYAFEPMDNVYSILKQNIELNHYNNIITIVPMGLSDKTALSTFSFSNGIIGNASLIFKGEGVEKSVMYTSVDDWAQNNNISRIDFIKAYIEGAERDLLKGARETLRRFKPRLAICTYHFPDDPQVLERIIKEAEPTYNVIQKRKKLFAYV